MVKPKSGGKKTQSRGVDFKKIKRKVGRRLPPPKNTTNTEIKSKKIILPEQSVASDKSGLALSRKGLTLKELLQHTIHHNAKVRKDALVGIKDLLTKYPNELKLHKLAVVEKLRERIGDDDKLVRETLYQLFKSVVFPGCPKDNQGALVSLVMPYIFNAMTHLAIDVRLMAFKFFDVVLQYYPSSFPLYAEKILQNYEDMLRRNQLLEDMNKFKTILIGLVRCLSLLAHDVKEGPATTENDVPACDILHAFEPEVATKPIGLTDVSNRLKDLLPILVNSCQDFLSVVHTESQLDVQSCDCVQYILQSIDLAIMFLASGKSGSETHLQVLPPLQKHYMFTSDPLLSLTVLKKLWDVFPLDFAHHLSGKDDDRVFMLNTVITKIFLQSSNWKYSPPALLEKFLAFIESSLSTKMQSVQEKHLLPLIPFVPELTMYISGDWRWRILQAFTEAFANCNSESSVKLACLSVIQDMLAPDRIWFSLDANDAALVHYQIAWIQNLPSLLISLENKSPLCSKAILQLQLCVGKSAPVSSPLSLEFNNIQYSFKEFFCSQIDEAICYGPFVRLAADVQELAICCLYYFSTLDSQLLQSLASCCLCDDLEPLIVFRILEVLQSSFKAGHIEVAEYTSFHLTLLSRFRVYPENIYPAAEYDGKSNWKTFKSVTSVVSSCLSQIGDDYLVLEMLEKIIIEQICGTTPLHNKCALLRLLVVLDSKPTRISDTSIVNMSHVLPQYLIDVMSDEEKNNRESTSAVITRKQQYYLLPSFYLFQRSKRLLTIVLDTFGTWAANISSSVGSHHLHPPTDRSTRVCAVVSVLLHFYKDVKIRQIMLSCTVEIKNVLQNLFKTLSSEELNLTLEERHKIQLAYDQLKDILDNELAAHS